MELKAEKFEPTLRSIILLLMWMVFSVTRKNAKCLLKLLKNDFTRKMIDFDTFTKIA